MRQHTWTVVCCCVSGLIIGFASCPCNKGHAHIHLSSFIHCFINPRMLIECQDVMQGNKVAVVLMSLYSSVV